MTPQERKTAFYLWVVSWDPCWTAEIDSVTGTEDSLCECWPFCNDLLDQFCTDICPDREGCQYKVVCFELPR